jgi:outer membrane biosynthesis protein TonB
MKNWTRRPPRPGPRPVLASAALHGAILVGAWLAQELAFEPQAYETYEITLVSMRDLSRPEVLDLPIPDPVVVEIPDPTPPPPEPPPPAPTPQPRAQTPPPEPPQRTETPPPPRQEPPPPTQQAPPRPTTTEAPPTTRTESAANVDLAVRMEGLQRDFPEYWARIVAAISSCWRMPPGVERISTVLRFEVERDGTVRARTIQAHQRSGNSVFDLRAVQAVECAGSNGRIPPLPDDLTGGALPIQFTFTASGFRD